MMRGILDYLDYRDFLKDFYETKKKENPWFSYRFMARRVDMDASHLVKILQAKRHIAPRSIRKFIFLCGLRGKEADYFETLVQFNKAKTDREVRKAYEHLLSLKDVKKYTLEKNQYEYYQKWYYSAIFTLLQYYPFKGDYAALAKKLSPAIKPSEAKRAVKLLKDLKLIRKKKDGNFELTNEFITTGEECRSIMIKSFQEETMRLAAESLHRHYKQDRNISTVTITIDRRDLETVDEMVGQFRNQLMKLAKETEKPDSVYQLNVQLFPMTEPEDAE